MVLATAAVTSRSFFDFDRKLAWKADFERFDAESNHTPPAKVGCFARSEFTMMRESNREVATTAFCSQHSLQHRVTVEKVTV